jgi:hypothetical protein
MSPFLESKKGSYQKHRAAAQGAGVILVNLGNVYRATFDCAKRIAGVLGKHGLYDMGDDIYESVPVYDIPSKEMQATCVKLSADYSIALVEYVGDEAGGRFVCIWKIAAPGTEKPEQVSENIDDY